MFKPGDRVRCIKGAKDEKLQEGMTYTVTEIYHIDGLQGVILKELSCGFLSRRFIKTNTEQDFTLDAAEN
jgi:hypothetical protein